MLVNYQHGLDKSPMPKVSSEEIDIAVVLVGRKEYRCVGFVIIEVCIMATASQQTRCVILRGSESCLKTFGEDFLSINGLAVHITFGIWTEEWFFHSAEWFERFLIELILLTKFRSASAIDGYSPEDLVDLQRDPGLMASCKRTWSSSITGAQQSQST